MARGPARVQQASNGASEQRLVEVEYIGGNLGVIIWAGPVTGVRYRFAAMDGFRVQRVDERDLDRFKGRTKEFLIRE